MFYSFSNSFRLLLHTLALTLNGLIRSWSPQRISSPDCRWKRDFWYPKASLDHPDSNVRMPQTPRYKFWFGSRWIFLKVFKFGSKVSLRFLNLGVGFQEMSLIALIVYLRPSRAFVLDCVNRTWGSQVLREQLDALHPTVYCWGHCTCQSGTELNAASDSIFPSCISGSCCGTVVALRYFTTWWITFWSTIPGADVQWKWLLHV